jgi:chemotaxis protein MotB
MDPFAIEEPPEPQQDELWLISYADLLTLLVGFFVLIIASMPLKMARFERVAAAISGSKEAPLQNLREKVDSLVAHSPELRDRVITRDDAEGLGIELKDAMLFDSGSAEIRAEGKAAVAQVAKLLRDLPGRPITVEGHTDDVPIATPQFRSNWELSSQRAINVLSALEASGVERARMSARAYADTRALSKEGSVEDRRTANRRVVIRVE